MMNCLIVALGGGLGACARYLIGLVPLKEPFVFPIASEVSALLRQCKEEISGMITSPDSL